MATDSGQIRDSAARSDDPTKLWYDRSSMTGEVMVMIPNQSVGEYFRRCPENRFCEYIDGVVYMPSPVELWHQFDVMFLSFLLQGFTQNFRAGHVLTSPAALRLSPTRFLEPDLFVVPFQDNANFQGFLVDPPVLLVVEVLSKSTRSHDLKRKLKLYKEASVTEVWLIDNRAKALTIHRRHESRYETERIKTGPCRCGSIPNFWFDLDWLWARPQPNNLDCLQRILAGPPS